MKVNRGAWKIVATREVVAKLTDKSYVLSTLFSMVVIVASIGISAFMGQRTTEYTVGTLDSSGVAVVQQAQMLTDDITEISGREFSDTAGAQAALESEEIDAYLVHRSSDWELVAKSNPSIALSSAIEQAVLTVQLNSNAAVQGVDLRALNEGSHVEITSINENGASNLAFLVGLIFAAVFFMAALGFGMQIAQSVVEEKQNRIVEIIATAIPISQLLAGKILGNIILALVQVALYAITALAAMNLTGSSQEFGWVLSSAGWFVLFYVVGFSAIATVWAAVGAMASRNEDIANTSMPLYMVLAGAFFGGLYSSGTVLTVLSYIPVISSIAMPMRLLTEDVAVWEPLLALGLGLLATWWLTLLGARIYRNNIMRSGSAVTWRQAVAKVLR